MTHIPASQLTEVNVSTKSNSCLFHIMRTQQYQFHPMSDKVVYMSSVIIHDNFHIIKCPAIQHPSLKHDNVASYQNFRNPYSKFPQCKSLSYFIFSTSAFFY